jgi:hypothetical protein
MARSLAMPAKRKAATDRDATKGDTMSFRLPDEDRNRLAALAVLMGERAGGGPLPESYALRAALRRGLDVLEAELGGKGKR